LAIQAGEGPGIARSLVAEMIGLQGSFEHFHVYIGTLTKVLGHICRIIVLI
jgi:hypothetical protein